MKGMISLALLAAIAAASLVAASPASASASWSCTARDSHNAHFTGMAEGNNATNVQARARGKAMTACHNGSAAKASCVIVNCASD